MEWRTRVTELLGCRYPIIQGAFGSFGTSALAAPVSEAGGFGIITAGALKTPEGLREDIRRARDMTDKPFGVNISMVGRVLPVAPAFAEVVLDEKVPVVFTAAYRADEIGKLVKAAGLIWIHKVATVRHAVAAERQGADAVVIVGLEGAGFKSLDQLPTLITITTAAKIMHTPIIAAGGIGDARGLLGALAMGAEAVYMGTRFMATAECPISQRAKEALVAGTPWEPKFRDRALATPSREVMEQVTRERASLPLGEWLAKMERAMLSSAQTHQDGLDDDVLIGRAGGSLAVGVIESIPTAKELIEGIMHEAEELLAHGCLARLYSSLGQKIKG